MCGQCFSGLLLFFNRNHRETVKFVKNRQKLLEGDVSRLLSLYKKSWRGKNTTFSKKTFVAPPTSAAKPAKFAKNRLHHFDFGLSTQRLFANKISQW